MYPQEKKRFLKAQVHEQTLPKELNALIEQRKKLQTQLDELWKEQQKETKPIDEKYNEKRKLIQLELDKLSSKIGIFEHAIGEQLTKSEKKSMLEDAESFRAYQELWFKSQGKRAVLVT